jgi:threonylcarbamoyladenosine tRNA methylthiotransferase MtaB
MPRFEVKQSAKLNLTSYSGLALIGQCCQAAQVEAVIDPRLPVSQGMRSSDLVKSVVNSCTVTNFGDQKSRKWLRRAKRENPGAVTVLTGCYPQAFPEEAAQFLEADLVCGNGDRKAILDNVLKLLDGHERIVAITPHQRGEQFEELPVERFETHTRAFIKVEDGCNRQCAYCVIPRARGPVRSRAESSILAELRQLAAAGYREVVLSAISLPSYGLDTGTNLVELVEKCAQVEGIERIRLGSLDPDMLTPEFITRLAAVDKLCPQFHLSLQSGCTATLRRMRRVYSAEQYAQVVDQIRAAYGSRPVSFTTDCICGFPGETPEDFAESCDFLKKIGFLKVHVFPYSRRSGTPAYDFPDQVHEREKQARSREMNALAEQVRCEVLAAHEGTEDDVLLETPLSGTLFTGYTRLYIPVVVSAPGRKSGEIVHVRLGPYDGERVRATLC